MAQALRSKGELHHRFGMWRLASVIQRLSLVTCLETATALGSSRAYANSIDGGQAPGSAASRNRRQIDSYVKRPPLSGGRKEVDRIDNRHCNDAIFRSEVEIADAIDDLLGQNRRLHIGRLQLAQ